MIMWNSYKYALYVAMLPLLFVAFVVFVLALGLFYIRDEMPSVRVAMPANGMQQDNTESMGKVFPPATISYYRHRELRGASSKLQSIQTPRYCQEERIFLNETTPSFNTAVVNFEGLLVYATENRPLCNGLRNKGDIGLINVGIINGLVLRIVLFN